MTGVQCVLDRLSALNRVEELRGLDVSMSVAVAVLTVNESERLGWPCDGRCVEMRRYGGFHPHSIRCQI